MGNTNQDPRLIPPEETPSSPLMDYTGDTEGDIGDTFLGGATKGPLRKIIDWELDWSEYRLRFNQAHGGKPVQIDEWLVWEDGWRCDAYDPGGTEMPPPAEPEKLRDLKLLYYEQRVKVTKGFYDTLRLRIETIESIQTHKSMPLQRQSILWSSEVGPDGFEVSTPTLDRGDVDLHNAKRALKDLQGELDYCDKMSHGIREL